MSIQVKTSSASSSQDIQVRETTVATAAVPSRAPVVASVRVETKAPEHMAEASRQAEKAAIAEACKNQKAAEAAAARPGSHAIAAISDIGSKISGKVSKMKDDKALKKHEQTAESEVKRAHDEELASKQAARAAALSEAERKARDANHGAVTAEFATGNEIVAVAEVPARGPTTGTGVATSHANDHLQMAARERERALEASARKAADEAKLEAAAPGAEAKAAVGGIGTKISAAVHGTKEWLHEKVHSKKAESEAAAAENALERDTAKAREMAKRAAEAEAERQDRAASATITNEATTRTVTATRA